MVLYPTKNNRIWYSIFYPKSNKYFLYTLYSLHKDDNVAIFLRCQKNNLNGILYILTKGKFDKYILIKDLKHSKETPNLF